MPLSALSRHVENYPPKCKKTGAPLHLLAFFRGLKKGRGLEFAIRAKKDNGLCLRVNLFALLLHGPYGGEKEKSEFEFALFGRARMRAGAVPTAGAARDECTFKAASDAAQGARSIFLTALRAGPPFSWGVTSGGPAGGRSFSKDGTRADSAKDFCRLVGGVLRRKSDL